MGIKQCVFFTLIRLLSIPGLFSLCAREDKSEAIQEFRVLTLYILTCMNSLEQHTSRVKLNEHTGWIDVYMNECVVREETQRYELNVELLI